MEALLWQLGDGRNVDELLMEVRTEGVPLHGRLVRVRLLVSGMENAGKGLKVINQMLCSCIPNRDFVVLKY